MELQSLAELANIIALKLEAEDNSVIPDINTMLDEVVINTAAVPLISVIEPVIKDMSINKVDFFNFLKNNLISTQYIDFDFMDEVKIFRNESIDIETILNQNKRFLTSQNNYEYYYLASIEAIKSKQPALIQKALDIVQSIG